MHFAPTQSTLCANRERVLSAGTIGLVSPTMSGKPEKKDVFKNCSFLAHLAARRSLCKRKKIEKIPQSCKQVVFEGEAWPNNVFTGEMRVKIKSTDVMYLAPYSNCKHWVSPWKRCFGCKAGWNNNKNNINGNTDYRGSCYQGEYWVKKKDVHRVQQF